MTDADRPQPTVLPGGGGLHVPGVWCVALVAALEAYESLLGGRRVPLGCRRPGLSRTQQQLLNAARAAAAGHEQRKHRAISANGNNYTHPDLRVSADGSHGFGDPAEIPPPSPTVITTSGAVVLAGRSERRWRQLAAQGAVTATQVGGQWLLDRDSVLDYGERGGA